jgi:S-adenosylmethionine:tRNA ribosyltransferase-isomerase
MKAQMLDYNLPAELIAQQPAARRSDSRLLVLERKTPSTSLRTGVRLIDSKFAKIGDFLREGDCLVLNDTKVLAARFFARRVKGGKLEGLFLRQAEKNVWEAMLKGLGKVKTGERIWIKNIEGEDFCCGEVVEKKDEGKCLLKVEAEGPVEEVLEKIGFAPLPPYINRDADLALLARDKRRYQTVYARNLGAVAAPTAGLHFTKKLLSRLEGWGIKLAYITLDVGEGTFKPVATETLEEHRIHEERFSIDEKNAGIINGVKKNGGRIIAVGTTSVRVLETVAALVTRGSAPVTRGSRDKIQPTSGVTDLFILPGYKFKMVDGMVTNFHLPRSTLLAIVGAFAGLETILAAYRYAIEKRYRFYSYGDAMFII